jgi:hypothetical protein
MNTFMDICPLDIHPLEMECHSMMMRIELDQLTIRLICIRDQLLAMLEDKLQQIRVQPNLIEIKQIIEHSRVLESDLAENHLNV